LALLQGRCSEIGIPTVQQPSTTPRLSGQELHEYAELAMAKSGMCRSRWSVAVSVNENWCCGETMHRVGKSSNCVFGDSRADTRISYVLGRIFVPVSMLRRLLAPGVTGRHLIGVRDAQRPEDLERRTRP
jgi:hypothetical protein